QLDGCPEDGPAIAVDAKGRTHVVWPTLASEQGAPAFELFYAMSVDDLASRERGEGQTFTARERIPTEGTPHHPDIAARPDGSVTLVWDELVDGTRHVASARGRPDASGRMRFVRDRNPESEPAASPAV